MTDLLITAWNLLEPSERPEGMSTNGALWWDKLTTLHSRGAVTISLSDAAARDRLIVACEGVLMDLGWIYSRVWYRNGRMFEDGCGIYDPDRLQAAVLALQAERGTHAK